MVSPNVDVMVIVEALIGWKHCVGIAISLGSSVGLLGCTLPFSEALLDRDASLGLDGGGFSDGDAGVPNGACTPGETVRPVRIVNASPWREDNTCDVANALLEDGAVAGLDLLDYDECDDATLGDTVVCSCIAADFGRILDIDRWVLRLGRVGNACGRGCAAGLCDSGPDVGVGWGSDQASDRENPTLVTLSSRPLQNYDVPVNGPARWLFVCRLAWSADRDDVVVDAVSAICD